jgi:uncharacterized protein YukE
MPTPYEVKSKARKIYDVRYEFSKSKDCCNDYVSDSYLWWKGVSGDTLRSEYKEIQVGISKLIDKMKSLENFTDRLSRNIQDADDERRRRQEEQRKLAISAANRKK